MLETTVRPTLTGLSAACAMLVCGIAAAQNQSTASGEETQTLEEIIVTAQRRAQSILDVPVSISALAGEAIVARGIEDVQRLGEEVPSLVVGAQSQTFGGATLFIRGIGSSVGDQAVGYYIDEIFIPNPSGFVSQFIDTERVEVLKGPQGTLWGRNTTAGAIHYITKQPGNELAFEAQGEIGYYDSLDASDVPIRKLAAAATLPVIDTFSMRISAAKVEQDNYVYNLELDEPEPNQDATSVRLSTRFTPSDALEIQLSVDYIDDPHHNSFLFRNVPFEGSGAKFIHDLLADIGPEEDTFRVRSDVRPVADYEERGARLGIDWKLDDAWTLRSITGARRLELDRLADLDVTQATIVHNHSWQKDEWGSEELQLQYQGEKHDLIVGGYYFTEENRQSAEVFANAPFVFLSLCNSRNSSNLATAPLCPLVNNTILPLMTFFKAPGSPYVLADFEAGGAWDQVVDLLDPTGALGLGVLRAGVTTPVTATDRSFDTDSLAFYGQWGWRFANELTLTAGVRWTQDKKKGTASLVANDVPQAASVDEKFSEVTPRIGLEWRPAERTLLYASVSKGFKSGALDVFADEAAGEDPLVDPESVWAYEIGAKGEWLNGKLALESAVFYYDYTDYQLSVQLAEGPVLVGIEKLEVAGLELGPTFRPVPQASLGVQLTYLDTEIAQFRESAINPFDVAAGPQSVEGNQLPNAPELKGNAFANYTWALGSLDLTLGATVQYSDGYFNDVFETFKTDGYTLYNVNARLESQSGRWWLNVYGRNLTSEEYVLSTAFADQLGVVEFYGPPRTIGVQLGVSF
jgi:iron complex outermembrane receptor protein